MPAVGQAAEQPAKTNKFTEAETEDLAAYVQSMGGGVQIPDGDLVAGSKQLAEGGELFRLNCASCHGSTGKGAPLSAGKTAPGLNDASAKQIYAAMLSGPESMPVFNDNQMTVDQKKAVVAYVQTLQDTRDPGGNGIDRIGPVSEGIVLWVLGVGALVLAILWIGAKA
jgi:ubiquinol-cytochrome c reductase cytochrome c subunit